MASLEKSQGNIKVFYDGRCNICLREIRYYQRVCPSAIFEWVDINEAPRALRYRGVKLSQGLMYLHVLDQEEKLHVGIDAFILIWKNIRLWHILALVISIPPIYQVVRRLYKLFSAWRFRRLEHCQIAAKHDD